MSERLVGTGVELRFVANPADWIQKVYEYESHLDAEQLGARVARGESVLLEAQPFADTEAGGRTSRIQGGRRSLEVDVEERDRVTLLIDLALDQRDALGDLLGDLRKTGMPNLDRLEFYSAPFRIDVDPELRAWALE